MPICNRTIQLVVVNLYTKCEVSILNGYGDIFDENVLRNYGRTDGRTVVVVVALLFYVRGKHLRSCRDGQLRKDGRNHLQT